MDAFKKWLATTFWGTTLKAFLAIMLTLAIAEWSTAGSLNFANWQAWLIAALVSLGPGMVNHLNSADTRYGRGSNARNRRSTDGPAHAAL
jgi:uncharacterized membrane protein YgaE (UPF0421/DUF939 family)